MSALFYNGSSANRKQTVSVTPVAEPDSKQWDIKGEDDLGLSSRYMTEFKLIDSKGFPVYLGDLDLGKKRRQFYAIGVLQCENKQRICIKTEAIRCWNVEVGVKPSSGLWIATKKAWYKLMKPHRTYKEFISPLLLKSNNCILIAAILRANGTDFGIDDIQTVLSRFEDPSAAYFDPTFLWTHLNAHFSPSSHFMIELKEAASDVSSVTDSRVC